MKEQFIEAVDEAIEHVVFDFQRDPSRHMNERDIHWKKMNEYYHRLRKHLLEHN